MRIDWGGCDYLFLAYFSFGGFEVFCREGGFYHRIRKQINQKAWDIDKERGDKTNGAKKPKVENRERRKWR